MPKSNENYCLMNCCGAWDQVNRDPTDMIVCETVQPEQLERRLVAINTGRNKMSQDRLKSIIAFLKEAEQLKLIERIPYLSDRVRRENDAEHSWYLALLLLSLEEELEIEFDQLKTYKMIMVHDLVEVYTKDDWAYDKEKKKLKQEREVKAAKKLFSLLPPDLSKKFLSLWQEYDAGKTIEAKIAKALDKICYTLQYSISKKIEWGKACTKQESYDYAFPHVSCNKTLLNLFEALLDELEETIDRHNKKIMAKATEVKVQ